ncbi:28S ribosomal protein S7, mitochondrial [Galemys pyrenaicus]|uniref:28S ribosomal protein S7, mitochondrial n=1 Tax=Galemys pyrenaicus TaxID=202257 RepID=A0A8J6DI18_GALPY|nr:28S ribosomal protein S7, mitochondrial [Galemys pyrenaicus]
MQLQEVWPHLSSELAHAFLGGICLSLNPEKRCQEAGPCDLQGECGCRGLRGDGDHRQSLAPMDEPRKLKCVSEPQVSDTQHCTEKLQGAGEPGEGLEEYCLAAPELTQLRQSHYGPEYKDPQINMEYALKPLADLTEEKQEGETRMTQLIKAVPATKTSSVFEGPLIIKFTKMLRKRENTVLATSLMTQTRSCERKQSEKRPRCFRRATANHRTQPLQRPPPSSTELCACDSTIHSQRWTFLPVTWAKSPPVLTS